LSSKRDFTCITGSNNNLLRVTQNLEKEKIEMFSEGLPRTTPHGQVQLKDGKSATIHDFKCWLVVNKV